MDQPPLSNIDADVGPSLLRHPSEQAEQAGYKRLAAVLSGQKQVLELMVTGAPLPSVLERLTEVVERQATDQLFTTILLLEPDGTYLRHVAGNRVPSEWSRLITPLRIGPNVGSCGTAAYLVRRVIVTDISTDPRWRDFAGAALDHGLRACWSTPILSTSGSVLGTFAMYYRTPRAPTEEELELVDMMTRTATIAIERSREEERRASLLEELQNANGRLRNILASINDGFCAIDREWRILHMNKRTAELLGRVNKVADDMIGKNVWDELPELVGSPLQAEYARATREQVPVSFEFFYAKANGWFEINAYPSREGLTVYFREITERKRAEQERERLVRELQRKREDLETAQGNLQEKISDLEKFHDVVVDRELLLMNLEEQVKQLRREVGRQKSDNAA